MNDEEEITCMVNIKKIYGLIGSKYDTVGKKVYCHECTDYKKGEIAL